MHRRNIYRPSHSRDGNAIGRVRPSVCFHSSLWTGWPITFIFCTSPSVTESRTLTTRLPSHPRTKGYCSDNRWRRVRAVHHSSPRSRSNHCPSQYDWMPRRFTYSTFFRVAWRGSVVERRSLTGELSLSCSARPAADGWQLMWVSHPL